MHKEYVKDFFEDATAPYFSFLFENVISKINGGDVCDLGAHAVGHFWAMGYIERVDSFSCYDYSQDALNIFQDTMNNLTGKALEKSFSKTIDNLQSIGLVKGDADTLACEIAQKIKHVKRFDFLKDVSEQKYDIVLAMESLPVVNTYEELVCALKTTRNMLKDSGTLLSISGQHVSGTKSVEKFQAHKIDGSLNPDINMFKKAMMQCGFNIVETASIPIDFPDYISSDYCIAQAASRSS